MFEIIVSLATLLSMEVLLGIDNIVILSILVGDLPSKKDRLIASFLGLILALVLRVVALISISTLIKMSLPLFTVFHHSFSLKDIIMLGGGLFLISKSLQEIFNYTNSSKKPEKPVTQTSKKKKKRKATLIKIILEIAILDLVFALDSILTAITISQRLWVMILANIIAVIIMGLFVESISKFLKNNPSFKILGLFFMLLIGFVLFLEAFHFNIPRWGLYSIIGFSLFYELLKTFLKNKKKKAS